MVFLSPLVIEAPEMRDGDVRRDTPSEDRLFRLHMTRDTWVTLTILGALGTLLDHLEYVPDGVYTLPRSIIDPDAAADLQHAIAYADLADPAGCVMPGCLQDPHERHEGFVVCREHHELLTGWDALVA